MPFAGAVRDYNGVTIALYRGSGDGVDRCGGRYGARDAGDWTDLDLQYRPCGDPVLVDEPGFHNLSAAPVLAPRAAFWLFLSGCQILLAHRAWRACFCIGDLDRQMDHVAWSKCRTPGQLSGTCAAL